MGLRSEQNIRSGTARRLSATFNAPVGLASIHVSHVGAKQTATGGGRSTAMKQSTATLSRELVELVLGRSNVPTGIGCVRFLVDPFKGCLLY